MNITRGGKLVAGLVGLVLVVSLVSTGLPRANAAPSQGITPVSAQPVSEGGQVRANADTCALNVNKISLAPGAINPGQEVPANQVKGVAGDAAAALAKALAEAAAKKIGGDLAGWAMSTLFGIGGGGTVPPAVTKELNKIEQQIAAINAELQQISAELAHISNEIKDSTYIEAMKLIDTQTGPLWSMWQKYCDIATSGTTDPKVINQWANTVTNSSTGVKARVLAISESFHGSSATNDIPLVGMFAQYAKDQNTFQRFDDQPAYTKILNSYTQHFANLFVIGMNLEVEAYHVQKANKLAVQIVQDDWSNLLDTFRAGGFPISNDKQITDMTNSDLWTRSPLCGVAPFNSGNEALTHIQDPQLWNRTLAVTGFFYGLGFSKGQEVCGWGYDTVNLAQIGPNAFTLSKQFMAAERFDTHMFVWDTPNTTQLVQLMQGTPADKRADVFLSKNGFVLSPKGAAVLAPTVWLANFDNRGFPSEFANLTDSSIDCVWGPSCPNQIRGGLVMHAPIQKFLGGGDYQGIGKYPGDAWLSQRWDLEPPPPSLGETDLTVKARSKSKQLKPWNRSKVVRSVSTNGKIKKVKAQCFLDGNKLTGRAKKANCKTQTVKKRKNARVYVEPKCSVGLKIKVLIVAKATGQPSTKWQRKWKVKNNPLTYCSFRGNG